MSDLIDRTIELMFSLFIIAIFGLEIFPELFAQAEIPLKFQIMIFVGLALAAIATILSLFQR